MKYILGLCGVDEAVVILLSLLTFQLLYLCSMQSAFELATELPAGMVTQNYTLYLKTVKIVFVITLSNFYQL